MASLQRHRYIPLVLLIAGLFLSVSSGAQRRRNTSTIGGTDTLKAASPIADSLAIDTLKPEKKESQPLDFPVVYEASDSIVFTDGSFAHLFGSSKVN
ncbi:MAG: LPS-assembly protein LptD, partial [Phocaeicola sp.]